MAISDYLSSDEWDACFYYMISKSIVENAPKNFGYSIEEIVDKLLNKGYVFQGLDDHGNKKKQIDNGINALKLGIFMGNKDKCDVQEILINGRNFVQQHCPELINETDEEWGKIIINAKINAKFSF